MTDRPAPYPGEYPRPVRPETNGGTMHHEWMSFARGGQGYCSCGQLGTQRDTVPYAAFEKHSHERMSATMRPETNALRDKAREIHAYLNSEACGFYDGGTKCLDCEGITKILAQHISAAEHAALERAAEACNTLEHTSKDTRCNAMCHTRDVEAIDALRTSGSALELERLEARLNECDEIYELLKAVGVQSVVSAMAAVTGRKEYWDTRIAALKEQQK